MWYYYFCFVFFFFQAEDGIRDVAVTGVQTCALPISHIDGPKRAAVDVGSRKVSGGAPPPARGALAHGDGHLQLGPAGARSEERRVGKECRSRWSADH